MNRVCCGAVDLSGIIHGEAVFKMNTTTSCGKVQTNPQEQWDLQEFKISCPSGTVLALHRCAQNAFSTNVSELLRRKNK